jgi:hypothetical protein
MERSGWRMRRELEVDKRTEARPGAEEEATGGGQCD